MSTIRKKGSKMDEALLRFPEVLRELGPTLVLCRTSPHGDLDRTRIS
jgi:hypothetical protein